MLDSLFYADRPMLSGVLLTPAVIDTLATLMSAPDDTLTCSAVMAETGCSSGAVYAAMAHLEQAGIVTRTYHGHDADPPVTYRLDADRATVAEAIAIFIGANGRAIRRTDQRWWLAATALWTLACLVTAGAAVRWGIDMATPRAAACSAATIDPTTCAQATIPDIRWLAVALIVAGLALYATRLARAARDSDVDNGYRYTRIDDSDPRRG